MIADRPGDLTKAHVDAFDKFIEMAREAVVRDGARGFDDWWMDQLHAAVAGLEAGKAAVSALARGATVIEREQVNKLLTLVEEIPTYRKESLPSLQARFTEILRSESTPRTSSYTSEETFDTALETLLAAEEDEISQAQEAVKKLFHDSLVRAENAEYAASEMRGGVAGPFKYCHDCGERMVWDNSTRQCPIWMCPRHTLMRASDAEGQSRVLQKEIDSLRKPK